MRFFPATCLLLFVIACNPGRSPRSADIIKPDSLIAERQMIRILVDVHLTEAALVYLRNHGKDSKELQRDYYNVIFSKYKISKKRFSENLTYYQADQENFLKMYNEVINQLKSLLPKESDKEE